MNDGQTLEEQLLMAQAEDRRIYVGKILETMNNKKVLKLYNKLGNAPMFVGRDIKRLNEKIMEDYKNGHPTSEKYIRKPENISAFMWLFIWECIGIREDLYFGIFKKTVIIPKYIERFND